MHPKETKLDRSCEDIFKAYAIELERDKKRARQQRGIEIAAEDARRQKAGLPPRALKRPRTAPQVHLPSKDAAYVKRLRKTIGPLYKEAKQGERENGCAKRFGRKWGSLLIHLERALIHLLFADGEFKLVTEAINSIQLKLLPRPLYGEIENLWNWSHYHTTEHRLPVDKWTPVMTFRVRKKHPCPTLELTGEGKYNIPNTARGIMAAHYKFSQRPSKAEKQELALETGLTLATVTNWFKNRRQRSKKASQKPANGKRTKSNSRATRAEEDIVATDLESACEQVSEPAAIKRDSPPDTQVCPLVTQETPPYTQESPPEATQESFVTEHATNEPPAAPVGFMWPQSTMAYYSNVENYYGSPLISQQQAPVFTAGGQAEYADLNQNYAVADWWAPPNPNGATTYDMQQQQQTHLQQHMCSPCMAYPCANTCLY